MGWGAVMSNELAPSEQRMPLKHFIQNHHQQRQAPSSGRTKENRVQYNLMSDMLFFFFFPSDIICANFDPTLKTDLRRNPKKAQFRMLAISPTEVSPYMRGNQGSRAWSHLEDNLVS